MIKLLIPQNKKTNIRGYWKDSNKLYRDYHIENRFKNLSIYELEKIKDIKKQICLFYQVKNTGFIFYDKNKTKILKYKKIFIYNRIKKEVFKKLLSQYNGLTVYKTAKNYRIEVFY